MALNASPALNSRLARSSEPAGSGKTKKKSDAARFTSFARRSIAVAALVGVWYLLVVFKLVPGLVPTPGDVGAALVSALVRLDLWQALAQTVSAALAGVVIASVIGAILGLVIGSIPFLDNSTKITLDFARSFPVIAIIPVLVLLMGATWEMEVLVIALSAIWPVLVQAIDGAQQVQPGAREMARIYRIPSFLKFRRILLPSAMPMISTGIRIAVAISILVAVAVEVLSQTPGLGRMITLAQGGGRWDLAFAYLILIGMFGWGVTAAVAAIENRLLRWARRAA